MPAFAQPSGIGVDVTYFNNYIHDLIEFFEAPDFLSSTEINVDRARTQGVESSLTVRPASWLQAVGTWTYTEAQDLTTGAELLRRPLNQLSLDVTATPFPGLRITPELLYTSRFQDYLIDNNGFEGPIGAAREGTVFNLTVTYNVRPKLQLFVYAKNLGGSNFEPASGYQIPGSSFLAGVRAGF